MTTDSRTAIKAAFVRLLALYGYQGASLDTVAREVAIRKPTIYHHFPGGKESLYAAVAAEYIESQSARLSEVLDGGSDVADTLTGIVEAFADPEGHERAFDQRLFDALPLVEEDVRTTVMTEYGGRLIDPVRDYVASAMSRGELREGDAGVVAMAFLSLAQAVDLTGDSPAGSARALVELFLRGAAPR